MLRTAAVISRRALLTATLAAPWAVACGATPAAAPVPVAPSTAGTAVGITGATTGGTPPDPVRIAYGQDASQFGELHLPAGERRPGTVVVIHGGFWLAEYGADLGTPLAADLAARGWVVWNLEYRRVGDGGGWPATLDDVAAGIDHLATIASRGEHGAVDTDRVVAIGHSAGGQLAAWAAARPHLGNAAPSNFVTGASVAVTGVVSQAGVLELATAADDGVGGSAVPGLAVDHRRTSPIATGSPTPQRICPSVSRSTASTATPTATSRCRRAPTTSPPPSRPATPPCCTGSRATTSPSSISRPTPGGPSWSCCPD